MKKKFDSPKVNDAVRRDDLMGGEIEKWLRVSRMPKEEISRLAEIGLSTLNERLRNPSEFRVKELRVIADIVGVDVSQLIT